LDQNNSGNKEQFIKY